jgi:hypothetical protein
MEQQSPMSPYLKETLIGVAAACFSIVVIVALMEGGAGTAFGDALLLLLLGFIAPIIHLPSAPWLIVLYAVAGYAIREQYKRLPPVFIRYLVGAEVLGWQLLGFWMLTNFAME